MMRILFLIFSLATANLCAQVTLSFDKRYVECEDKWVAFNKDKDNTYIYGFIYIDEQAGLTFNYEGKFEFLPDHTCRVEKLDETNMKVRLEPNNVKVAIIPESMYKDLGIDSVPEWLKSYKTNVNSIERLYKWGFTYNGWNECAKALEFLLKARAMNANHKGVAVELAYSYNCLGDFDKALEILEEIIQQKSDNAYVNKEYIYALVQKGDIDKAVVQYKQSIKSKIEATHNVENCFNILGYYYKSNDIKNFDIWAKEIKKWSDGNELIDKYVNIMKKDLKDKQKQKKG